MLGFLPSKDTFDRGDVSPQRARVHFVQPADFHTNLARKVFLLSTCRRRCLVHQSEPNMSFPHRNVDLGSNTPLPILGGGLVLRILVRCRDTLVLA